MKKESHEISRRDFLKASTVIAGAAVVGSGNKDLQAQTTPWPAINPAIDNLRVVCCTDPKMLKGTYGTSFAAQNAAVDAPVVEADMDKMAMTLANTTTAAEAWGKIFMKPSTKQWNQVRVAMKVNCINTMMMPRVAVMGKICKELNNLGVPAANIVVYDGCHDADGKYNSYVGNGLPVGVIVSSKNTSLGGTVNVTVDGGSRACTADLVNAKVDILVNFAVNKDHDDTYGNATLCMKNHFGTFAPVHSYNYLIAINKHSAIVGGTPARQQLCIMDSLWACVTGGPGGNMSHTLGILAMGTFGPAVDHLTSYKIRAALMSAPLTANAAKFLTDFGYTAAQRDALNFIVVDPGGTVTSPQIKLSSTAVSFSAQAGGTNPASQNITITNTGAGTLANAVATITYGKGSGWLRVTQSGTGNTQILANAITLGTLAADTYTATVSVACTGAVNTPQTYTITLTVAKSTAIFPGSSSTKSIGMEQGSAYDVLGRKIEGKLPKGLRVLLRNNKKDVK